MKNLISLFLCLSFVACNYDKSQLEPLYFEDLPQPVRDTLAILHNLYSLPDNQYPETIDLIDLSGGYSIHYSYWHTWLMITTISNSSNKYVTEENLPTPIVVYNNVLYIPNDYDLIIMGFDNSKFHTIKFK